MFRGVHRPIWIIFGFAFAMLIIGLVAVLREPVQVVAMLILFLLAIVAMFAVSWLLLLSCVAVHEVGHLLAGWAAGNRLVTARVGPFGLNKWHGRWRIVRAGSLAQVGGFVFMVPRRGKWKNGPLRWFIAGGPIASAIVFGLSLWMFISVRSSPHTPSMVTWLMSYLFLYSSAVLLASGLIPMRIRGHKSDLLQLLTLHRPNEVNRRIVDQAMESTRSAHLRASDWDHETVMQYVSLADGSANDMNRYLMGYLHLRALKRDEEALPLIMKAERIALKKSLFEITAKTVHYCAAIGCAEIANDAKKAREAFRRGDAISAIIPRALRPRAHAAVLIAEGKMDNARFAIDQARYETVLGFAEHPEALVSMLQDLDLLESRIPKGMELMPSG